MGDAPLTAVIVPAAGRGERLGPGAPKALRTLAGQPILLHAVRNLATARDIDVIVVAVPEDAVEESRALLAGIELPITIVSGGDTRQDSVARALLALPPDVDVVLVHDAARPLVPAEVVDPQDRGVGDLARELDLADERRPEPRGVPVQDLHRDRLVEPGVERPVDGAHPARAQFPPDGVTGENLTLGEQHGQIVGPPWCLRRQRGQIRPADQFGHRQRHRQDPRPARETPRPGRPR